MNSWLQTACQPNSFWYGTTRSSMKRRPRSVARRAGTISVAPTLREGGLQLGVGLDLLLHLPQGADLVPVAVVGGVLEAAQEDVVHLAVGLLHDRPEVERRAELREVQHPVDLPVPVVHVDGVLEEDGQVGEAELRLPVEQALDVVEVALHLGDEARLPPVGEVVAVDRQDEAEVGADLGGVLVVLGDDRVGLVVVLLGGDVDAGLGRDGGRVQVAVDVLVDPVRRERRPEPAEHVVAGQPPAADVLVHRAQGLRAVEVVEDPEQQLLGLGRPLDRERLVPEELAEDFFLERHRCFLLLEADRRHPVRRSTLALARCAAAAGP